jgi:NO-binding membrane sensor protein with MHYT domain
MNAAYILLGVGAVFLIAAIVRLTRDQGRLLPQSRTWFLIAGIFAGVGIWLVATQ